MQLRTVTATYLCLSQLNPLLPLLALTHLSLLLSSRALLEGKSIRNLIQGTWASVYEVYVAVVTATTLLLKLGARVHDWASRGTSLGGQALLLSQLFWLLGCKLSLILFKHLYGVTTLARLLANKGPAIYVVHLNRYFVIPPWYYLVITFCDMPNVISEKL